MIRARNVTQRAHWGSRGAAVSVITLGPLLTALALRLPPINQLEYADAWFYSAYAWEPRHHFEVYDPNYFSVRFPAILSIGIFERVLGPHAGYVALRYLIAIASGVAVYLGVRRFATASVAVTATALLYLHPFFSRTILWDYSEFIAVPAGVAAIALWWWNDGRRPIWSALSGTAFAIGVYAHFILATAVFVFCVVELVAAMRSGRAAVAYFAKRLAAALVAAVLVFFIGYLSYLRFFSITPGDLLRPTIEFLFDHEKNFDPYERPVSEWLPHELRLWSPVIMSVALIGLLRRRILGTDVEARIAQMFIGYVAFLWVYRFTLTSSVLETWWSYNTLIVAAAPAVGVILHNLPVRRAVFVVIGGAAAAALAIRTFDGPVEHVYGWIARRPSALFAVVAVGVVLALLLAVQRPRVQSAALAGVIGISTFMAWAPSVMDGRGTTGVFALNTNLEWDTYGGAKGFLELVRDHDSTRSRVYTWYPERTGPTSIGWTTLPHLGHTVHEIGTAAPMDVLRPLGRARLLQPDAAYVLAISVRARDLTAARRALSSAGFQSRDVRAGTLADGRLRYVLILLTGKPPA